MLESIITGYLRQNRRLVIPGLGAFLRKEEGETVFVPFLNKDDGILNGLVRQNYGSSAAEAEGIIAQYVNNIRTGIELRGAYLVSPLGSLKSDANGVLFLDTADLNPQPVRKAVVKEPVVHAPEPVVEPEPVLVSEPVAIPEPVVIPEPEIAFEPEIPAKPVQPEPRIVADETDAPKTLNDLVRERQEQQVSRPTLNDLMAEPEEELRPVKKVVRPASPPQKRPASSPAKNEKRGDMILIAAVVIAVLAVIAMIYGYAVSDTPLFNLK